MLDDFATWLATKTGLTKGTNLFQGYFPATAPELATVVQEVIPGKSYPVNPSVRTLDEVPFSVVTRSRDYDQARTTANAIYEAINLQAAQDLGDGWTMQTLVASARPQYIGPDDRNRFEYRTTYVATVEGTA